MLLSHVQGSRCTGTHPSTVPQMSYARFMSGLFQNNIVMNRKVLSELAMTEPWSFKALVDQVRFMRGGGTATPGGGGKSTGDDVAKVQQ